MNAWTSVFTAASVNDCLIDRSCRSWKNPDRQTADIWSAIVSWLSIRMPRFLTAVENCSTMPFRNINVCGRVLFSWCRVPSQMICILSSFSFRRLLAIQSRTRSRQPVAGSQSSSGSSHGTGPNNKHCNGHASISHREWRDFSVLNIWTTRFH